MAFKNLFLDATWFFLFPQKMGFGISWDILGKCLKMSSAEILPSILNINMQAKKKKKKNESRKQKQNNSERPMAVHADCGQVFRCKYDCRFAASRQFTEKCIYI